MRNFFTKLGLSISAAIILLSPTWIALLISHWLAPQGFWQMLLMLGFWMYIAGGLQFVSAIILLCFVCMVWLS